MMTYEESVRVLRAKPELAELVKACYLDEDNKVAADRFYQSEEFAAISGLLGLESGSLDILDLGCGNGIAAYSFAMLGHRVAALDPDRSADVGLDATERLRHMLPRPDLIKPTEGVAEALPYPDNSFDVIYTRQAVHHFRDLDRAFAECRRVLRPGGRILATREHVVDDARQLAIFLQEHALHHLHGGENAYPLGTYVKSVTGAGLRIERVIKPFDSVINHFPASNADIRNHARTETSRRAGLFLGGILAALLPIERIFRWRASRHRAPGRMYSILARKPA